MGIIRDRYPMYYQGHPKLYFKRKPIFWWTKKWAHLRFIIREMTSVAVAWFALVLIFMIRALGNGPEAFSQFETRMEHPVLIILNLIALIMLIYHSITWFNLAPKAIVLKFGANKIPGYVVAGMNFAAWIVFSIVIFIYMLN